MAEPRIKYDIAANVTGNGNVDALASSLEKLADTLDGDVKRSALASAQALRDLGARQGAIESFTSLKREAQDAAGRLTEAQASAQKLARELAASESPTRAQTGQLQKLRDAVRAAKAEVEAKQQALGRARTTLQGYGLDTSNLATKQQMIREALRTARAEVESIVPAYQRSATAGTAAGNAQAAAANTASKAVGHLGDQVRVLESLQRTLVATMATVGVSFGLREIGEAADAYAGLQARMKLVTGEGANFETAMAGVAAISQRTGADLAETGNLFTRLAQAGKDAGKTTQAAIGDALGLTETINQAIAVSGAGAEASKAAITQLIQGLQSGVLRGEEFNSMMEQAPRLARALADGLGVTTGELRRMSQAGALTTATVINALQTQSATLRQEFETLPPTLGRSLQKLSNAWTVYIGEADKAKGVSRIAAGALDTLSQNIGKVAEFLSTAGKAAAAFKLIDLATSLNAKATAAQAAARAIATEATATTQATAATQANTAATAANTAAKRAHAVASDASAAASAKAAASNLTVGQAFQTTTARATGLVARLAGVASGIGAAWLAIDVGGSILKSVGTALGEGVAKLAGYRDRTKELEAAEKSAAAAAQAGLEVRNRQNLLNRQAIEKTFELSKASRELIGDFDGLIAKGESAGDAIAKIGKDFNLDNVEGIKTAGAVLDKLAADAKITAGQFAGAWQQALKDADLGVFEVQARTAFSGAAREAERLAAAMDASAREAIRRTGLDFDLIAGGMGKASRSAINDTEAIIRSLDSLQAKGVDTARALTASLGKGIETADSQKALDAVRAQIETVRAKLGDKVADGLLQQAADKARDLKQALESATPGIQSVEEAMRRLGVTSDATLKRAAADSKTAYDTLKNSGTASARELQEAFQRYAQDAIAANKGVADGTLQAEAAQRGLRIECDETGRAIVRAMNDGRSAAADLERQTYRNVEAFNAERKAALDAVNARYSRPTGAPAGQTADGFKAGADGAASGTFNNLLPVDQAFALAEGRVTDLQQATIAMQQAENAFRDMEAFTKLSPGASSIEYQNSTRQLYTRARTEFERLQAQDAAARSRAENPGGLRSVGGNRVIELKLGGRTTAVEVASEADSDRLEGFLRGLENQSKTSA